MGSRHGQRPVGLMLLLLSISAVQALHVPTRAARRSLRDWSRQDNSLSQFNAALADAGSQNNTLTESNQDSTHTEPTQSNNGQQLNTAVAYSSMPQKNDVVQGNIGNGSTKNTSLQTNLAAQQNEGGGKIVKQHNTAQASNNVFGVDIQQSSDLHQSNKGYSFAVANSTNDTNTQGNEGNTVNTADSPLKTTYGQQGVQAFQANTIQGSQIDAEQVNNDYIHNIQSVSVSMQSAGVQQQANAAALNKGIYQNNAATAFNTAITDFTTQQSITSAQGNNA